ncbi:MAG: hypothetical protein U1F14_12360 [Steroidobacteraceae bacterium]
MKDRPVLTPYDEFPVHQAPVPFSQVPSTDLGWDDGYFFCAFNAALKVILFTGMRVSPNSDMIGGYAGISIEGRQYTVRFSREWRPDFATRIGPLSYAFTRPLREIALRLDASDFDLSFDLVWEAVAEAWVEAHHVAHNRQRRTTDQTRYTQTGTVSGHILFRGRRFDLARGHWTGTRDHSWGLYAGRAPLVPDPRWLPPPAAPARRRALRFWMPFRTADYTGFYHFHEDEDGSQAALDDVFGTPFEGVVDHGFDGPRVRLVSAVHALEFVPGTRSIARGVIDLVDESGRNWRHEIETAFPPWTPATIGYAAGSWRDGGTMFAYHGPGVVMECDEFDLSRQPCEHRNHLGQPMLPWGVEHIVRLRSTGPGGVAEGEGYLEFFLDGRYTPYGFE